MIHRKQRITPRALLDIKSLSDITIHPDGQRIAFSLTQANLEESTWISHIWLTEGPPPPDADATPTDQGEPRASDEDSTRVPAEDPVMTEEEPDTWTRQLTYSDDGEHTPRWSPDGRYLAFLSIRPDLSEPPPDAEEPEPLREQIWVLPTDGGEARRITTTTEGVLEYAWHPDSESLIFLTIEPRPRPLEAARRDRIHFKVDPIVEHEPRRPRQFWRVGVEEGKSDVIYTGDLGISDFCISPDGNSIFYTTNRTGDPNDYHEMDLQWLDITSRSVRSLAGGPGGKYEPKVSPDGNRIAYLSWRDSQLSYSQQCLFVVERDSADDDFTEARQIITPRHDTDLLEYVWRFTDGRLYGIVAEGVHTRLICVDTDEEVEGLPDGELDALAAAPQSAHLAFLHEDARSLPEVFLLSTESETQKLTRLNAEFVQKHELPRREIRRWRSPDGTEIEGILMLPARVETTPLPLIVQLHGGPKGRAADTLQDYCLPAAWAAEGYAVFRPNYRGSEGYGPEFATANRRDLGGGDLADVMSGVEDLIACGIADPNRLGIMGGSYGGFLTNCAIGSTNRFKAAISMFGIFHLQTDFSNSELPRWDLDYLGAPYWEDPEVYARLSPGTAIKDINTPTLVIHGDEDRNTNITNSRELYQALRHRGVPTSFVHYPRESHGLREPGHRLDEARRWFEWMERYLRPTSCAVYRPGDSVRSLDGRSELQVLRAEPALFIGRHQPESESRPTIYLQVDFTLNRLHTQSQPGSMALQWDTLALTSEGDTARRCIGIPLDGPGGKILVEGTGLRSKIGPDPDTGEVACAASAVFEVPREGGEALFTVEGFPAVRVMWTAEQEREAEKSAERSRPVPAT